MPGDALRVTGPYSAERAHGIQCLAVEHEQQDVRLVFPLGKGQREGDREIDVMGGVIGGDQIGACPSVMPPPLTAVR